MKKIAIVAVMAIAVAGFTACGNKAKKGGMKTDIDSLSYAIGMEQSQGVDRFLEQQGIDSTYMDEFIKGIEEGINEKDDKKKQAHNMGVSVGVQLSQMKENINRTLFGEDSTQTISMKQFVAGFKAGAKGKGALTVEQARLVEQTLVKKIQDATAEKNYGPNKKKGQDFIAKVAKQDGVKKLTFQGPAPEKKPLVIYYKEVKAGTGAVPNEHQTVKVEYEGKTVDGKVFDTTKQRGATNMPVGGVIPGFTAALTHMPVGSTWEIYIPYEAAYGSRQMSQDILPFSALQFTVTLVSIEQAQQHTAPIQVQPQGK